MSKSFFSGIVFIQKFMAEEAQKIKWEHFEHKADIGVRGFGATKELAFENTAIALTAVISDPLTIEPQVKVKIHCQANDDELLLVDWLNSLLYEMDIRKILFCKFKLNIKENNNLDAIAWGEKINVTKHQPAVEVKAATYNDLRVEQLKDGSWAAQCVVDV